MTVLALIGAKSLYLLYGWLLSAIVGAYLSDRKGYGEKVGLASGLLLPAINVIVWILWPARRGSKWKEAGVFGSQTKADRRAKAAADSDEDASGR
jgi:hypothetical protein